MKVAILYNGPEKESPDSVDVLEEVFLVAEALLALGHEPAKITVPLSGGAPQGIMVPELFRKIGRFAPDVIFNLVEAIGANTAMHPLAAGLLEAAGFPFTGARCNALFLTTDKRATKTILAANGIPTAKWVAYPPDGPGASYPTSRPASRVLFPGGGSDGGGLNGAFRNLNFPVIVKPACEDASIGITDDSVMRDERALSRALPSIYTRLGGKPLLIEEFIDGREFNVSIIERRGKPKILPPAEMLFANWPPGKKPRIVNYKAKWHPDAFEYKNTVRTFKPVNAPVEEIRQICLACWQALGLTGYARVDLRLDEKNRPFVMEVNANPCIAPFSGFISAVKMAGYTEKDAVGMILEAALPAKAAGKKQKQKPGRQRKPAAKKIIRGIRFRSEPVPEDRKAIKKILAGTKAFHRREIEVALELLDDRLSKGFDSEYMFLFCEIGGKTAGYVCYGPITMTKGRFDLYWIAVDVSAQGKGIGSALLKKAEAEMARLGCRHIYAETASKKEYALTREFYRKSGYSFVALVPEYFAPDDDKLIFMKTLKQ